MGKPDIHTVVIWPGKSLGKKWVGLARLIRDQTGGRIAVLCATPSERDVLRERWQTLTSDLETISECYEQMEEWTNPRDVEARARRYEQTYDTLMVELLQADRHLGLGYVAGGTLFPRSRLGLRASYHDSLHLAMRLLDFFEAYLHERQADVILMGGAGTLYTKCLCVVARRRGIPVRSPITARHRNFVAWFSGAFCEMPWLQAQYDQTVMEDTSQVKLDGPHQLSAVNRQREATKLTLSGMVRTCASDVARRIYQRTIGYRRLGQNLLRDTLAYRVRTYQRHRWLERHSVHDLRVLDGAQYIFYPLHHEPESSLMVEAPEFNHQAAIIDLLAKALPAHVRLLVKEHSTGFAARPPGFHQWVHRIPNVILVSQHVPGIEVIKRSRAVAVLTSTAGLEAAIMGTPVLSFGWHNFYTFLPHVYVVDSIRGLRARVAQLCDDDDPQARQQRQQNGRRLLEALKACSLDLGDEYLFSPETPVSQATLERLIALLWTTLEAPMLSFAHGEPVR